MLSTPLGFVTRFGQNHPFDPALMGVSLVGCSLHPAIGTDLVGDFAKLFDMVVNGRLPLITVGWVPVQNPVVTDKTAVNLIQPDLVSELGGMVRFTALDDGGMRLKQADQLVPGRHTFFLENPPHGLVNDPLCPVDAGL